MTKLHALVVGTLLAGFAVPALAVSTELVTNGGFENSGFGGTTSYYNIGGPGADHAVPAGFGFAVPVNNVDIVANGVFAPALATGGKYNLDLVGYGSTGAIVQFFTTRPGAKYTLSFDYAENNGVDGATAIAFSGNGTDATIAATHAWQHYTGTLIGSTRGGLDGIAFNETYGANNGGVFLDNISVTGNTVPEPAAWALMVAGFGLVGAATRCRRSFAAA